MALLPPAQVNSDEGSLAKTDDKGSLSGTAVGMELRYGLGNWHLPPLAITDPALNLDIVHITDASQDKSHFIFFRLLGSCHRRTVKAHGKRCPSLLLTSVTDYQVQARKPMNGDSKC